MLSLAALPLFAMLIGLGFRRSKPAGYSVTHADRILVVLMSFAALGAGTNVLRVMRLGPEVEWLERIALIFTVTAFYVGPLFLYLVATRFRRHRKAVRQPALRIHAGHAIDGPANQVTD